MAEGVEILLVRHGQTGFNAEGRFLGRSDPPLDEVGLAEAEALARGWAYGEWDRLLCSPLVRAVQTAAPLGEADLDPRLAEVDHGELEGLRPEEAIPRFPELFSQWRVDPEGVLLPGGESLPQAAERALDCVKEAVAAAGVRRVVFVSHQLTLASVCCRLAGLPLREWRAHRFAHCEVRRLVLPRPGG